VSELRGPPAIAHRPANGVDRVPSCAFEDRKTLLTLNDIPERRRSSLFAEYRMARYLTFGPGQRYGEHSARTVRCKTVSDRNRLTSIRRPGRAPNSTACWPPWQHAGTPTTAENGCARIGGSRCPSEQCALGWAV